MCLKKRASFYLNFELKYWSLKLESSVDMPNYCVAVGCKNTAKKGSEYSFHRFPHQNPNLLKKWVHAIRRKQWKPTKHSFICSDHFHESCFVIRPGAEAIANAKQASKQAIRYNEHTKQFALTLHYYSPRAYDFVRQVLLLPHPSCIRSWAASVDCEPGFLCDVISFLGNAAQNNAVLSDVVLIVDAMAIRKGTCRELMLVGLTMVLACPKQMMILQLRLWYS